MKGSCSGPLSGIFIRSPRFFAGRDLFAFDDGSVVVITEADVNGYDSQNGSEVGRNDMLLGVNLIYQVKVVSEAALARLSFLWLRSGTQRQRKIECDKSDMNVGDAARAPPTENSLWTFIYFHK